MQQRLASLFEGLPDVRYGDEEHFLDADRTISISKWILSKYSAQYGGKLRLQQTGHHYRRTVRKSDFGSYFEPRFA